MHFQTVSPLELVSVSGVVVSVSVVVVSVSVVVVSVSVVVVSVSVVVYCRVLWISLPFSPIPRGRYERWCSNVLVFNSVWFFCIFFVCGKVTVVPYVAIGLKLFGGCPLQTQCHQLD